MIENRQDCIYTKNSKNAVQCIDKAELKAELLASSLKLPYWSRETIEQRHFAYKIYSIIKHQLKDNQRLLRKSIFERNLKKLSAVVDSAYISIPYYKELYNKVGFKPGNIRSFEDFNCLPLLSKSALRELYQSLVDDRVQSPYFSTTSGSSGQPVMLLNDELRTCYWYALRLNMFEDMLKTPFKDGDWTYNYYYEPFYLREAFGKYKLFSAGLDLSPEKICHHIRKLRPRLLTGVASRVLDVVNFMPELRDYGVEVVSTNSESSSKELRRSLEKSTGLSILDEYSSEELGIIAWEDPVSKNYKVSEDALHLELIPSEYLGQTVNKVVGTCFNSYIMPRIRYVQGDFADWAEGSCNASSDLDPDLIGPRFLSKIHGREDMALVRPDGKSIHPSLTLGLVDRILLKAAKNIQQFRLIQKSRMCFSFLLIGEQTELAKSAVDEFTTELRNSLGSDSIEIHVEWVHEIARIRNKHRSIMREF